MRIFSLACVCFVAVRVMVFGEVLVIRVIRVIGVNSNKSMGKLNLFLEK